MRNEDGSGGLVCWGFWGGWGQGLGLRVEINGCAGLREKEPKQWNVEGKDPESKGMVNVRKTLLKGR